MDPRTLSDLLKAKAQQEELQKKMDQAQVGADTEDAYKALGGLYEARFNPQPEMNTITPFLRPQPTPVPQDTPELDAKRKALMMLKNSRGM